MVVIQSHEAQPSLDTADDNGAHVQMKTELCGGVEEGSATSLCSHNGIGIWCR
jgi:hypothetical protein